MLEYSKLIFIFIGIVLIITGLFLTSFGISSFNTSSNLQNQREYSENNKNSEEYEKNLNSEISYSGIIMIGPIPIVFGNSPYLIVISLLTLILMIIWIYLSIKL